MTDVLAIAMQRRDKLRAEIGRVDQFLRLAVELVESVSAETKIDRPAKDLPTRNVEPGSGREAAVDQPVKHEPAAKPAQSGRASIFRGAFVESDELPMVVNG